MGGVIDIEQLWDVKDVAKRLKVSEAWVRDHSTRRAPLLPVRRIGGNIRYKPEEIERWINAQGISDDERDKAA